MSASKPRAGEAAATGASATSRAGRPRPRKTATANADGKPKTDARAKSRTIAPGVEWAADATSRPKTTRRLATQSAGDGARAPKASRRMPGEARAAKASRATPKRAAGHAANARGAGNAASTARPGRRGTAASANARPSRRMTPGEISELFTRLSAANPVPTTELEYSSPYELLVAVALSAQMTDVGVNKATRRLFPVANTPQAIAKLGVAGLAPYLATINFNRTKGANLVAMAEQLLAQHGGEVPREREALEALPGVGRKTANVVLNTAFGETTLAVDTHIFRVSNRTGLAPGRDVRAVEDALHKVVPAQFLRHAHHWLLLHGRYTCKARVPDCPRCIVRDLCHFPDKTPGTAPPLEIPARARQRSAR